MNVYIDTSVILRRLLNQPTSMPSWGAWDSCYTSTLTAVEFHRAIDRLRLDGNLTDRERVELQSQFNVIWEAATRVILSQEVLDRASAAMPTVVGTLDAIHLATALGIPASQRQDFAFLTHDVQLATAAMAMGLEVEGSEP